MTLNLKVYTVSKFGAHDGNLNAEIRAICYQRLWYSPLTLVSGNTRFVWIFAGFSWKGDRYLLLLELEKGRPRQLSSSSFASTIVDSAVVWRWHLRYDDLRSALDIFTPTRRFTRRQGRLIVRWLTSSAWKHSDVTVAGSEGVSSGHVLAAIAARSVRRASRPPVDCCMRLGLLRPFVFYNRLAVGQKDRLTGQP